MIDTQEACCKTKHTTIWYLVVVSMVCNCKWMVAVSMVCNCKLMVVLICKLMAVVLLCKLMVAVVLS